MDGSVGYQPRPDVAATTGRDVERDGLPDREWGLSAGQVAAVVAAIIVVSEAIGALF